MLPEVVTRLRALGFAPPPADVDPYIRRAVIRHLVPVRARSRRRRARRLARVLHA